MVDCLTDGCLNPIQISSDQLLPSLYKNKCGCLITSTLIQYEIQIYLHPLYHKHFLLHIQNPPTNHSQRDSFLNLIKFFYCVSSVLLVSDSRLWSCRPRAMQRDLLLLSFLVTFHKNIFSTFVTILCMLQCTSKATICGRRLVLLPEDCDLRSHRNPAKEIQERRTYL